MTDAIPRLNAALEGRYRVGRQLGQGGMAMLRIVADAMRQDVTLVQNFFEDLKARVGK